MKKKIRHYKSFKEAKLIPKKRKICCIYLFRHGQSRFNKGHIFTGWLDSKLTPLGIRQANKIRGQLKNREIDVAVQTRLSRSKDTLARVLKPHKECEIIIIDDRMIERSYGKLQGHHHSVFVKRWGEAKLKEIRRSYSTRPPGGESIGDVEKRVNSFIKDLLNFMKKYKVNVAISAHGNSMRPFRRHFEKFSREKMVSLENPFDRAFIYKIRT